MLSIADKRYHIEQIRTSIETLNQVLGTNCPMPLVTFSLRGEGRLGVASGHHAIKLHAQYAAALGRDEYRQISLHEACHTVTVWRRAQLGIPRIKNDRGPWGAHNIEWRRAMRTLGLNPDRTYKVTAEVSAQINTGRVSAKRVPVHCGCETAHLVTPAMATKIRMGDRRRCSACHTIVSVYPKAA